MLPVRDVNLLILDQLETVDLISLSQVNRSLRTLILEYPEYLAAKLLCLEHATWEYRRLSFGFHGPTPHPPRISRKLITWFCLKNSWGRHDIVYFLESRMADACNRGNLPLVLELMTYYSSMSLNPIRYLEAYYYFRFRPNSCVDWVLQQPGVNVKDAFNGACEGGRLELAQQIYANHHLTPIDIKRGTFTEVCKENHFEVAWWLDSLQPHLILDTLEKVTLSNEFFVWLMSRAKMDNATYGLFWRHFLAEQNWSLCREIRRIAWRNAPVKLEDQFKAAGRTNQPSLARFLWEVYPPRYRAILDQLIMRAKLDGTITNKAWLLQLATAD